jgi:hypothetical protein
MAADFIKESQRGFFQVVAGMIPEAGFRTPELGFEASPAGIPCNVSHSRIDRNK